MFVGWLCNEFWDSQLSQVAVNGIIEVRRTRWIRWISLGHYENHPLSGTGQQHAVCVCQIELSLSLLDPIPPSPLELMVRPPTIGETEVAVPHDACPVELEALHLKLGCNVLQVVGRACVVFAIEKPFDRISFDADVNRVWLKPFCFGRHDNSVAFRSPRLIAQPLLGLD